MAVMGKVQHKDSKPFQRLPSTLKNQLRDAVWSLSKNAAGLYIEFKTAAASIKIEYQIEGTKSFPHMPATGVSGIDLFYYQKDSPQWVRGNYAFKDTISYHFKDIKQISTTPTYRLYLPLYATVKMDEKLAFQNSNTLTAIQEKPSNKPVIIYGTSIAQGACASRPGMAWTNLLGQQLNREVVNLGFSGNGQLETPIIDFIGENNAALIALDCMPNFPRLGPEEAETRLLQAVENIRIKQPKTPILLVEHGGYSDGDVQTKRFNTFSNLNEATRKAYKKLIKKGHTKLYLLSLNEIGLGNRSFVDGTHPNDYGMMQYAHAYAKKIETILNAEAEE